ncbi:MAG: nucleotidyltransferase domain-containing protein [Chromatiales bacterium]|nr:nucleotidyltransferase domain-containing protein [Chromatiales bacterium]
MDAQSSVERLRQAFKGRERGIAAVYLFGSVARGDSRPGSDLDVAVLLEPAPERGTFESLRLGLHAELESELGQEIDFVVLNHAPPDLTHRVLHDSVLVIEPDPSARVRFEVRARNEYWDLKPYLDEYRRSPGVPR